MKTGLKHWKDKIILRVLVTTVSNGKKKSHLDASDGTSSEEYFVRMGADETLTLFGVAFDRLAKAMEEKKNNITELDESRFGEKFGIKRPRPNQSNVTNPARQKPVPGWNIRTDEQLSFYSTSCTRYIQAKVWVKIAPYWKTLGRL